MSYFSNFEFFERVPGTRKTYKINHPLGWEVGKKNSGFLLVIDPEVQFDLSIPRFLEWIFSPHDRKALLAAAVHDELLRRGFDEAFSSAEFRRALIARGVSKSKAWLFFWATLSFRTVKSWFL